MKTLLQGARDMERAAAALGGPLPAAAVASSAKIVKESAKREMDKIAPSGRFSHVGTKGAAVGVSYTITGSTALVRATGPWQLVENDTKAHVEFSRGVGRAQGRSKAARFQAKQRLFLALFGEAGAFSGVKALKLPNGQFRYRVNIPSIPGRHPWAHGVDKAVPLATDAMRASVLAGLRGIFR